MLPETTIGTRLSYLQSQLDSLHTDALLIINGSDSCYETGSTQATNFLLNFENDQDLLKHLSEDFEESWLIIDKNRIRAFIHERIYRRSIKDWIDIGQDIEVYNDREIEDREEFEFRKLRKFVKSIEEYNKVGMVLSRAKGVLEVEKWPLIQAFGLNRVYFTRRFEVKDVSGKLRFCVRDKGWFDRVIEVENEKVNRVMGECEGVSVKEKDKVSERIRDLLGLVESEEYGLETEGEGYLGVKYKEVRRVVMLELMSGEGRAVKREVLGLVQWIKEQLQGIDCVDKIEQIGRDSVVKSGVIEEGVVNVSVSVKDSKGGVVTLADNYVVIGQKMVNITKGIEYLRVVNTVKGESVLSGKLCGKGKGELRVKYREYGEALRYRGKFGLYEGGIRVTAGESEWDLCFKDVGVYRKESRLVFRYREQGLVEWVEIEGEELRDLGQWVEVGVEPGEKGKEEEEMKVVGKRRGEGGVYLLLYDDFLKGKFVGKLRGAIGSGKRVVMRTKENGEQMKFDLLLLQKEYRENEFVIDEKYVDKEMKGESVVLECRVPLSYSRVMKELERLRKNYMRLKDYGKYKDAVEKWAVYSGERVGEVREVRMQVRLREEIGKVFQIIGTEHGLYVFTVREGVPVAEGGRWGKPDYKERVDFWVSVGGVSQEEAGEVVARLLEGMVLEQRVRGVSAEKKRELSRAEGAKGLENGYSYVDGVFRDDFGEIIEFHPSEIIRYRRNSQ